MPLSVALGTNIQSGAFGGGNQFAQTLTAYLKNKGIMVSSSLTQSPINIILVTSVKPWARGAAFDIVAALRYVKTHPSTKVVLRVNECDERKGQRMQLLNNLLRASIQRVDHTIFVSKWLQDLLMTSKPALRTHTSVIRSGADPLIFNPTGRMTWNNKEPLKIITHHWSNSWYKGWDVYQALDQFLGTPEGQNYHFTFIGNPWPKANLKHTQVMQPHSGQALAATLKQHHVYISASQNEPAGMHYIEAMQCGLPVLWRHSGSLPEYCAGFGVGFDGPTDVNQAVAKMKSEYETWRAAVAKRSYTADTMCAAYLELFTQLYHQPPQRNQSSLSSLRLSQGLLWLRDSLA